MALSPGESRLATALSMAPVPLLQKTNTSLSVLKIFFRPSRTRPNISRKSLER